MKEQDITKVEFLLMCNENIVVQRFFNVRGFNKNVKLRNSFLVRFKSFAYIILCTSLNSNYFSY